MKWKWIGAFALVGASFAADVQVVDQVIARVNGDIVSQDEIARLGREKLAQLRAEGESGPKLEQDYSQLEKNVLRDRIDELLLIQKGKELNINVDSEVSKYMANLQRQSGITDPDKFHEYIRQQSGMSYEDFSVGDKEQFLTREVIGQEVGRHIKITDKEMQDYYNAHKSDFYREEKVFLSEILISTKVRTRPASPRRRRRPNRLRRMQQRASASPIWRAITPMRPPRRTAAFSAATRKAIWPSSLKMRFGICRKAA